MRTKELGPEARILLTEELYEEVKRIHNRPWKPFWKSFSNFHDLNSWKEKQKDTRLW